MSKRLRDAGVCAALLFAVPCFAQTVDLTNGDRISGTVRLDGQTVIVATPYAGEIRIPQSAVVDADRLEAAKEVADDERDVRTKGRVRAGYQRMRGDTVASSGTMGFEFSRETDDDEASAEGETLYLQKEHGSSMTQQATFKARYTHDIGMTPWYALTKAEYDHDKSADLRARGTPQAGAGYRFWDTDLFELSFETALAYEATDYYRTQDEESVSSTQRLFAQWVPTERITLREELDHVASLMSAERHRFRNTAAAMFAVDERWAVDVRLTSQYDESPADDAAKYNARFVTALSYGF